MHLFGARTISVTASRVLGRGRQPARARARARAAEPHHAAARAALCHTAQRGRAAENSAGEGRRGVCVCVCACGGGCGGGGGGALGWNWWGGGLGREEGQCRAPWNGGHQRTAARWRQPWARTVRQAAARCSRRRRRSSPPMRSTRSWRGRSPPCKLGKRTKTSASAGCSQGERCARAGDESGGASLLGGGTGIGLLRVSSTLCCNQRAHACHQRCHSPRVLTPPARNRSMRASTSSTIPPSPRARAPASTSPRLRGRCNCDARANAQPCCISSHSRADFPSTRAPSLRSTPRWARCALCWASC